MEVVEMNTPKPLYIYTARDHPKRGHRYLAHFRIRGTYKDIRHVTWLTDLTKGYVRVGEFMRIDQYWKAYPPEKPTVTPESILAARSRRLDAQHRQEADRQLARTIERFDREYNRTTEFRLERT